MRSMDNTEVNKSSISPKSRLQLTSKLAKFENTVNCREIRCSFMSCIARHYKCTNTSRIQHQKCQAIFTLAFSAFPILVPVFWVNNTLGFLPPFLSSTKPSETSGADFSEVRFCCCLCAHQIHFTAIWADTISELEQQGRIQASRHTPTCSRS